MSDLPIPDIYHLQANNCQLLHMQCHGKVTPFISWILPMLSWFYVQDSYLSCSRTILVSQFHPQEAIDTKKVHGYSQIPNRYPTQGFETSVQGRDKWYFLLYFWKEKSYHIQTVVHTLKTSVKIFQKIQLFVVFQKYNDFVVFPMHIFAVMKLGVEMSCTPASLFRPISFILKFTLNQHSHRQKTIVCTQIKLVLKK